MFTYVKNSLSTSVKAQYMASSGGVNPLRLLVNLAGISSDIIREHSSPLRVRS